MQLDTKRILILGGTGEARALAHYLDEAKFDVITSLAGRTDNPFLPDGKTRIGGFGGAQGLAQFLREEEVSLVVDATHPFAARISSNAVKAVRMAGVEMIRLERPPWQPEQGDQWIHVQSLEDAVTALPEGCTVFVTIGRQQLAAFLDRHDIRVIARAIEAPKIVVPENWMIILERPPFTLEEEIALFRQYNIDILVTKNAGGGETYEKLVAARAVQKPVIIIDRLPKPPVRTYGSVEELKVFLDNLQEG